jgi:hypothetical protein
MFICIYTYKIHINTHIKIKKQDLEHQIHQMPAFLAEIIPMAGAFFVIFSILICCINADKEDSYTRRLRILRTHKCSCKYCKKKMV